MVQVSGAEDGCKRVVLYYRVPTKDLDNDHQEMSLRAYAERADYEFVSVLNETLVKPRRVTVGRTA